MKRDHPFSNPKPDPAGSRAQPGKAKVFWGDDKTTQNDAGNDELLAVLGYKVKTDDMYAVAQKLEELEKVMGCAQEDGLSHLSSATTHYNPADLHAWYETLLSELNDKTNFDPSPYPSPILHPATPPQVNFGSTFADPYANSDLAMIPGTAILTPPTSSTASSEREAKRPRPSNSNYSPVPAPAPVPPRPVVVDSQENGIRLVHALMACAEAIQQENLALAEALVKQIGYLAASQAGSMKKVATYFAEALARRIYKLCPKVDNDSDALQMNFYDTCPYLKFAHFTANQAILEAFSGKKKVHVIDFSMNQGMQWPPLMQALAIRPEGAPIFRLTGIGPPAPDNSDRLQEVGKKLAQFAESTHIKFQYRGFVANSLTDLEAGMLDLDPDSEVVAVNAVFDLHRLLSKPAAIEKVFGFMKKVNPVIVTVVEQEANHNGPVFLDRFNESLHYYSTLFDSLERAVDGEDKKMSEVYLGRQICNVVACEGLDRVERHETLAQWRTRFGSSGFVPVHLGSAAFKQASMLLEYYAGPEGYGVEEREGCLMMGWHSRPLITTSAWQLAKIR